MVVGCKIPEGVQKRVAGVCGSRYSLALSRAPKSMHQPVLEAISYIFQQKKVYILAMAIKWIYGHSNVYNGNSPFLCAKTSTLYQTLSETNFLKVEL